MQSPLTHFYDLDATLEGTLQLITMTLMIISNGALCGCTTETRDVNYRSFERENPLTPLTLFGHDPDSSSSSFFFDLDSETWMDKPYVFEEPPAPKEIYKPHERVREELKYAEQTDQGLVLPYIKHAPEDVLDDFFATTHTYTTTVSKKSFTMPSDEFNRMIRAAVAEEWDLHPMCVVMAFDQKGRCIVFCRDPPDYKQKISIDLTGSDHDMDADE